MVDLDNIFKLCVPKYVYIRDAKLGLMKYSLMGAIFCYVVCYQILYSCKHLEPHHAQGFGKIWLQHPVDNCDELDKVCLAKFDNVATLPYCKQYTGTGRRLGEDDDALDGDHSELDGDHGELDGEIDGGDKKKDDAPKEEPKTEPKAEAKAEPKTEPKTEPKEEPKTEAKAEPKTEAKAEPNVDGEKKADKKTKTGPQVGDLLTRPKTCRYLDNRRLMWEPSVPSEIFIPLRYKQIEQKKNPDCFDPDDASAEGDLKSKNMRCKTLWNTINEDDYYVADVGAFTLHLSHSFNSPMINMYGVSTDFQGIFAACPINHPLDIKTECKRFKVPGSTGDIAPEDSEGLVDAESVGVTSLKAGKTGDDVISLQDLLRTTPVAQRNHMKHSILDSKLPDGFGHGKESLREKGGMLLLDVNYANTGKMRPGVPGMPDNYQLKPVTYEYRPYFVPTKENTKFELVEKSDSAGTRTVDVWYGITLKMQFNGELVAFKWAKILKAMTTGLVLLSMATTIVTAMAAYVMPLQDKYNLLMYQMSEDFSDYKTARQHMRANNKYEKAPAMFATGDLINSKLDKDGNPVSELTNAEIVKTLCANEMRLTRLDGMDPKLVLLGDNEKSKFNKAIGQHEKSFYTKPEVSIPEAEQNAMSWKRRINPGAE